MGHLGVGMGKGALYFKGKGLEKRRERNQTEVKILVRKVIPSDHTIM